MKSLAVRLAQVSFAFSLIQCSNLVSKSSAVTSFGIQENIGASLDIYTIDANQNIGTFLGSLRVNRSAQEARLLGQPQIEIPENITAQIPSDPAEKFLVSHVISRVRRDSSTNAWYLRSPILYSTAVELDSVTTVVFEMLSQLKRQGLWDGTLSRSLWEGLYVSASNRVSEATTMALPELFGLLKFDSEFLGTFASNLGIPSLSSDNFSEPETRLVHWYPSSAPVVRPEGEVLQSFLYVWKVDEANPLPVDWFLNDNLVSSSASSTYIWNIPMSSAGNYTLVGTHASSSLSHSFSVTVSNVNEAPTWMTLAPVSVRANTVSSIDLSSLSSDPDGDDLVYELASAPAGITVSGNILTLAPVSSGTSTIEIVAVDSEGVRVPAQISLTVILDTLPVFAGNLTWTLQEGTSSFIDLAVTDADGDPINVQCIENCPESIFSTPTPAGAGSLALTNPSADVFRFTMTPDYRHVVSPANSLSMTSKFRSVYTAPGMNPAIGTDFSVSITINNVNDAPTFTGAPPNLQTLLEGTTFTNTLTATDNGPNPSALTFACTGLLSWMNFNTTSHILSSNPSVPFTAGGLSYADPVICTVTDNVGLSSEINMGIQVEDVNRSPSVIAPMASAIGGLSENVLFTYDLATHVSDPDLIAGDTIEKLQAVCDNNCPQGLSIVGTEIQWTPTYNQAGTFDDVTFIIYDKGGDQVGLGPVDFTVGQIEGPPIVGVPVAALNLNENQSGSFAIAVDHYAGDTYDYDVDISCSPMPQCTGLLPTSAFNGTFGDGSINVPVTADFSHGDNPYPASSRTYSLTISVIKTGAPSVITTKSYSIIVSNVNRLPTAIYGEASPSPAAILSSVLVEFNGLISNQSKTVKLYETDADTTNDQYTWSVTNGLGSISLVGSTYQWKWIPTSVCWGGGSSTFEMPVEIELKDSRGGVLKQTFTVKLKNFLAGKPGCPIPLY